MRDVPGEVVVVEPGRALVCWDLVECAHQGSIKERYVFLCSDVIYMAKPSFKDKVSAHKTPFRISLIFDFLLTLYEED